MFSLGVSAVVLTHLIASDSPNSVICMWFGGFRGSHQIPAPELECRLCCGDHGLFVGLSNDQCNCLNPIMLPVI